MAHAVSKIQADCAAADAINDFRRNCTNGSRSSTPVDAESFFSTISPLGYPEQDANAMSPRVQPWRAVFDGPVKPKDGKLLIACPKGCDWGSNSGLGGY